VVHAAAARAFQRQSTVDEVEVLRDISTPAGHGDPDYRPRRYACPHGDYVWYRRTVSQEPPLCRTHAVVLDPAERV
jgi:hypothetical protein